MAELEPMDERMVTHSSDEEDDRGAGDEISQKLALFQEITGINDTNQCQRILESHQWNVEAAVQDAFNEQEGMQPVFNTPAPPPPRERPITPLVDNTRPHPPPPRMNQRGPSYSQVAQPPVGWLRWLLGWGFLPIRWILSVTNEIYHSLVSLLFGAQPPNSLDPVGDVRQFITQFEAEYGTDHPAFLCCSYGNALDQAKREIKFLLIYLHSSGHRDTAPFCRDVLISRPFNDILSSRDCLLWAVDVNSEEGTRVSYVLRESTYPFLALVMLRGSRMTVITRIEGYGTPETVVQKLNQAITINEPELVVLRTERFQRDQDQQLRQQQEEEFQLSLLADQEKARKREEELNEVARKAELEKLKEEEKEKQAEDFEQLKQYRVSQLPPEPSTNTDPSVVHISMKMPDGDRIERRFNITDQLQSLYDFAYTYDGVPKAFTLFTSYPKKELHCNDGGGPTLGELGFSRKVLVFVQSIADEDEEDE